jgi:hypothetical protein
MIVTQQYVYCCVFQTLVDKTHAFTTITGAGTGNELPVQNNTVNGDNTDYKTAGRKHENCIFDKWFNK